LTRYFIR